MPNSSVEFEVNLHFQSWKEALALFLRWFPLSPSFRLENISHSCIAHFCCLGLKSVVWEGSGRTHLCDAMIGMVSLRVISFCISESLMKKPRRLLTPWISQSSPSLEIVSTDALGDMIVYLGNVQPWAPNCHNVSNFPVVYWHRILLLDTYNFFITASLGSLCFSFALLVPMLADILRLVVRFPSWHILI